MSNVAKLKKRALEYEQKKQFDKALETYAQILDGLGDHVDEADVALYNRVGDLLVRRGDVAAAVDHYEKAVDLYTDGGFFNNAIALCNKILRNAPGRTSIYYKLGKISAKKGFVNDAKQNFLEYADRMQRSGALEEAFRALKEFADLCPDQDDIRLMLADQLVRKDRKGEAIEQLQVLYEKFQAEGRTREARATVDRMKALDPELEPKSGAGRPTPKANDLVFLDVNFDVPNAAPAAPAAKGGRASGAAASKAAQPAPAAPPSPPLAAPEPAEPVLDADLPFINAQAELETSDTAMPVDGLERAEEFGDAAPNAGASASDLVTHDSDIILGFEQTTFDVQPDLDAGVEPLAGLEAPLADEGPGEALGGGLGELSLDEGGEPAAADVSGDHPSIDLPLLEIPVDDVDARESVGGDLTFIYPGDTTPDVLDDESEPAAAADAGSDAFGEDARLISDAFPDADDLDQSIEAALDHARVDRDPLAGLPSIDPGPLDDLSGFPPLPPADGAAPLVRHAAADAAVQRLRAAVDRSPNDFDVRRQLAEALLEEGERDLGLAELEHAMLGFETAGNLRSASAIAEEMIRVEPGSVRFHQKRVEYAVRANDKTRLVDAYLSLAECLFGSGQLDKSRAVYSRVLELNPADERARAALAALGGEGFLATPVSTTPISRPAVRPAADRGAATPAATPAAGSDADFVNLSDWLREDDATKNTRMVVDVGEPKVEQQVDFAEMLSMFKQGVAANVDETDHESHYDLGVAYKEMGLLDEAISEFQKALRGTEHRGRTYEALGQCFVEKRQYQIALTILSRALTDQHATDDQLVGVLYLLGYASEALGRFPDALKFYERVFAVDIQFRDIGDRLAAVERRAR